MGWQPGSGGTGNGPGKQPGPGAGLPGPPEPPRDPRLAGFTQDGAWDACPPSAALAVALEAASGSEWRSPGATRDELLGLLRRWQALESWAAAGKLGLLRALIRDDDQPLPSAGNRGASDHGGGYHGDLPDGWTRSLTHEVALALSMPAVSAERLMWLAWNLQSTLPGTGGLLAAGDLTLAKARAVDAALANLTDQDAAKAEAMILPDLPGKTYGQVEKLAVQAAITVDPDSATRRREDAERYKGRVHLFREESGAAGLSGRDLPTDQALAAHANVSTRAAQYKDSGAFGRDTRMDQFRVAAYLDLLNGITAAARIASGRLVTVARTGPPAGEETGEVTGEGTDVETSEGTGAGNRTASTADCPSGAPGAGGPACACRECDGSCQALPGEDPPADEGDASGGDFDAGDVNPDDAHLCDIALIDLTPNDTDLVLPLATLLGLAERPGEGHGLGPLDPELCRQLAAAAVASPLTRLCVTVTGPGGIAVGHGCARLKRPKARGKPDDPETANRASPGQARASNASPDTVASLPARVNLTITAERLAGLVGLASRRATDGPSASAGPPGRSPWAFTNDGDPGPPGGYGTWTLTLPDGRNLIVELEPLPTLVCDHRHESRAYQPNDRLRHLVQVRDYECTFPPCSRHARDCDFEHATPYDRGGRTCGCNAGARSRRCHQVKQSSGWAVTQPRPGWHQWETPAGRVYIQGPKRYPA
jgi:hypothetical protein